MNFEMSFPQTKVECLQRLNELVETTKVDEYTALKQHMLKKGWSVSGAPEMPVQRPESAAPKTKPVKSSPAYPSNRPNPLKLEPEFPTDVAFSGGFKLYSLSHT